ncbi:MAG: NYN domain-containing protein [Litorimonas sp.]
MKTAVFIDGSNVYAAAKALGFDIDYKLLREHLAATVTLQRASYYTAIIENDDYSPLKPLTDFLGYNGYNMVTKPAKEHTDSMGRRKVKGNMDVDMAVDMMEVGPHVDHVMLFSGDGDFVPVVKSLHRQGVLVTVVSTIKSQPRMCADELRCAADVFLDLETLKDIIARPAREPYATAAE